MSKTNETNYMTLQQKLQSAENLIRQGNIESGKKQLLELTDTDLKPLALKGLVQLAMLEKDKAALVAYLDSLIACEPGMLDAINLRAQLFSSDAAYMAAATLYTDYLSQQGENPDIHFNAAYYLKLAGQFETALEHYNKALNTGVSAAHQVYLNMAVIHSDYLMDDKSAERCLERALEIKPDYADAWYNLANLAEQQGNAERARACFHRVRECDPAHINALARLADLKTYSSINDPEIAEMHEVAKRKSDDKDGLCNLYYGLGKALNDCEDYQQAWQYYAKANDINRGLLKPFETKVHRAFIDDIISSFNAPDVLGARDDSEFNPVFICGMFRSGSTLLEQILGGSEAVTNGGEIEHIHRTVVSSGGAFPRKFAQLDASQIEALRRDYLNEVRTSFASARYLTDKRPENYLYVGLIKQLFPNARFIWTLRNPFDNALSAYFQRLGQGMSYATDLDNTLSYYRDHMRLKAHWEALYPESIFTVNYDELVADPEPILREVFSFLNLEWDPGCLSFHTRRNSVKTASVWQVRKPLYKASSGRTRHYIDAIEQAGQFPAFVKAFRDEG